MNKVVTTSVFRVPAISHVVFTKASHTYYVSTQLGVDVAGKLVGDGIVEQTAKALQNLEAVLTDVGVPVKSIVKVSVFLTSLDHWKEVRGLLDTFFDGHEPARDIPIITPMSLTGALVGFSAIAVGI